MSLVSNATEINNNKHNITKIQILYRNYENESQLDQIRELIEKDLSEPYSIYVYRYFLETWSKYCYLALLDEKELRKIVGVVVCQLQSVGANEMRGYIAMLAVHSEYRNNCIGTNLVRRCVQAMIRDGGVDEIVLETEVTNVAALKLYEKIGFIRYEKEFMYYLNGIDAFRLKLIVDRSSL